MTTDSIPPDKHASFELEWRSELSFWGEERERACA
ncbi:unnamed protein product [Tetraodon nigroviridis]|uniref:(spotted green pufferfish) hypothetical protein n=1 Tax=Tetraodon nigroviridis TaxID=99883 RepID=Q4RMF4_TETNG|nr:unnamed protein product [Tetraodon nigroviridis]